jgi:hypothetical protein
VGKCSGSQAETLAAIRKVRNDRRIRTRGDRVDSYQISECLLDIHFGARRLDGALLTCFKKEEAASSRRTPN